ncbi:MAG: S1/P1 Nuclease [Bacteroidetes bacterium]|nr:S1/P1 Nuclease [Bacteroidota bacterium]MCL5738763.1 S1/P1 Nuclease [Bacteroidota bacterium]
MKALKKFSFILFVSTVVVFISQIAFGWGFWAHPIINKEAVSLLPEPLKAFYLAHVEYVSKHAVDPDLRRAEDKDEGYYHYMDLDRYGKYPNFNVPHTYEEAVKKFGKETVMKNGLVPWRVGWEVDSLSAAMKAHNVPLVLHLSADLGHYVADMHVPLHATENYDGQMTGNIGVHFRWESGIPEHFGKDYSFTGIGNAVYIKHPVEHAFKILDHSYSLLDKVFRADSLAKAGIPKDQLYHVEKNDGRKEYIYSDEYYKRFNKELDGMVEAQMRAATRAVASYWYTAWVDAGKPKFW